MSYRDTKLAEQAAEELGNSCSLLEQLETLRRLVKSGEYASPQLVRIAFTGAGPVVKHIVASSQPIEEDLKRPNIAAITGEEMTHELGDKLTALVCGAVDVYRENIRGHKDGRKPPGVLSDPDHASEGQGSGRPA